MTFLQDPNRIVWRPVGEAAVIDLVGDVTSSTEAPLRAVYQQATSDGKRHVILHFHHSTYMTSAGIALVLRLAAHSARLGQSLALTGLTAHYDHMFRLAGLAKYAPIYDSEHEALAAVQQPPDAPAAA